ncbi:hypothetical protein RD055328_12190 [Companilactobacillus sp. RD055328]|uniref:DUF2922 domain-containing protein n=1 Tax=Companilactobacillus sp. RD055328 TaxID=2916634 RepID=UPI001FC8170F|nr:DUF2922 domain-containing protein [Companilactobacillus sp. RD055328]GKQ43296.1 hypothetical protein RD055328_12190 [Companilactobacillus sp. RD055328]
MRKLQLGFKTAGGARRSLTLNYFRDDLKTDEVKAAMQQIADAQLFNKDGDDLYHEPLSAKYITKTEDYIFGDKDSAPLA